MNEDMNDVRPEQQTTAVSIFGEAGAAGDFPVLKAFQEYIEAEQAKARKRMFWLTAFFVTVLIAVIVVFSVIMSTIITRDQQNLSAIATRNQELSDKLLDIALKNREQAAPQSQDTMKPVLDKLENIATTMARPQQTQPTAQDTMKPVLEKLENLASAMTRPQQPQPTAQDTMKPVLDKLENIASAMARPQPVVQPQMPVQQPMVPQQPVLQPQPTQAELLESLRLQEDMKRLQAELKAEQERQLKAEKERQHQEEVERHRRRLYPEYYAKEDAKKAGAAANGQKGAPDPLPKLAATPAPAPAPAAAKPAAAPLPKPVQPAPQPAPAVEKKPAAAPAPQAQPAQPVKPLDLKNAKPVTYFDEEAPAAPAKPAEKKAEPAPAQPAAPAAAEKKPEVLNVGTKDGKALPFLVEPESK